MNHINKCINFSIFILLLVVVFILPTQIDVYAQDNTGECTEPNTVPDCTGSDLAACQCGTTVPYCCPLTTPGSCSGSFSDACTFSTCSTDPTKICKVPAAPPPPPVRATRNITFINNCTEIVWVGGSGVNLSNDLTGFELNANATNTITVPGNLQSANFWPRTSCTFPCTSVPCCETGDCANENNKDVECKGGTKGPPANSFEVTFNESPDNDFYDITNVDGFTVPIAVQEINGVKLTNNPTINGVSAPQLNCGNPACSTFNMSQCPPELSHTTSSGRQICWGLGGAANDPTQRETSAILKNIAADCNQLALVGAACSAMDTGGNSCGTTAAAGCGDSDSLFCCSPYNDNLPATHGGVGCADPPGVDINYVNPCTGVWPTPDATWCSNVNLPTDFCTYNGVFEQQCSQAYSWQFNDSNSTYQCINPDYQVTFCPTSANTDHDGVPDSEDTDSDNDGITNAAEGQGTNSKQNPAEISATGPADPDGDGIPNSLDLDSDGDGIPDHNEGGGTNDKNSDGYADNFIDIDGDGHHDRHDEDQGNDKLPLPDTDGDGIPDFLDTDSDGDGITDANETGSIDMDGDGILDNSEDRNQDGLADSVHPATGAPVKFSDSDNDGVFDHLDADDQNNGCSIAETGSSKVDILWLLVPVALLLSRTRRKK